MRMLIAATAFGAALAATPPLLRPIESGEPAANAPQQPSLTRQQARERADQRFDQFDLNHDGIVTREEVERLGPKLLFLRASTGRDLAPGIGGHTLRFLKHRFARVQAVTRQQFEAAFLAHFDQMDTNHDGILTTAERRQAR